MAAPIVAFLLAALASSPTDAYTVTRGGFSDGADSATLTIPPSGPDITGPSIRLLTNGTVVQGAIVVSADSSVTNVSLGWDWNSTPFFSSVGNLTAGVFVTLDVGPLNDAIHAARGADPVPETVDLAVIVRADGPGSLTLSQPRFD